MIENTTTNVETTEEIATQNVETTKTKKKVGANGAALGILTGTALAVILAKVVFRKVKDKKAASNETTEMEG